MKRLAAVFVCALFTVLCSITASAQDYIFELTPDIVSDNSAVEYMPEQQIYHFTESGDISAKVPVYGGIYLYVTLGGYHSEANGVTDNGINSVCHITLTCLDENGEVAKVSRNTKVVLVPADGTFRRYSLGSEDMYMGLPEEVKTVSLTVYGENSTAYVRNIYITSSDTAARDMTSQDWEVHSMGNINAQTSRTDYIIMVGFVCAVALIMMIVAKVRQKYKKGG